MTRILSAIVAVAGLTGFACSLPNATLEADAPELVTWSAHTANDETVDASAPEAGPVRPSSCDDPPGTTRKDQVCRRWSCEAYDAATTPRWNGATTACQAGEIDTDSVERALRLLNVRRFMAGLEPVRLETSWTDAAQQCALIAHANQKLSHTPPPTWECWSDLGALTSSVSLVANRSAAPSIAAFFEDPGNESTMTHRRWLLSQQLESVGIGSTDRYACIVIDGRPLDTARGRKNARSERASRAGVRTWAAWPPPGPVPIGVFDLERLDEMGWTIQSDTDELERATVKVTESGALLPVKVERLTAGYGSTSALRFMPDGWRTEADRTYRVSVAGTRTPIDFTVEPTVCP